MPRPAVLQKLTIELPEGKPSEFRIWRAGVNPTRNGYDVLFDAQAAEQVMAAFGHHGVELMIDLEHLSLEQESRAYDPDARGWCKLEVRDGELWAVDVRWTSDGERRLSERTQRYVSPAFYLDEEGRPTRVVNIALVAMPATDGAVPLAARHNTSPKRTQMINLKTAIEVARRARRLSRSGLAPASIVKRLSEDEDELEKTADGEVAGVDVAALAEFMGIAVDPAQDPAGFVAELLAALDGVAAKLRGAAEPESEDEDEAPVAFPGEEMAASREVLRITGAKSMVSAISTLADWRKLAVEHEAEQKRLSQEREALKATRYRLMTQRLVKCGAELPATAWSDPVTATQPSPYLLSQSLDQLEARAVAFEGRATSATHAPAKGAALQLSERELRLCKSKNIDPEAYASKRASIKARSSQETSR
jgi:hypothetical protein